MGACLDSKKNLPTRILRLSLIFFQLHVCTVFYSSNTVLHVKLAMFASHYIKKDSKNLFLLCQREALLGDCMHPIIFEPPGPLSLLYLFSLSWLELRGREREREREMQGINGSWMQKRSVIQRIPTLNLLFNLFTVNSFSACPFLFLNS